MEQSPDNTVGQTKSWDDTLLLALLTRVADQLRSDALAYEEALEVAADGEVLTRATRVKLESDDCARKLLLDDADNLVSVLRKMK